MNSKIRINHDFDHNESYIQIELEDGDLNDNALNNFVQQVNMHGVELVYPKNNQDNRSPQLRVKQVKPIDIPKNPFYQPSPGSENAV